MSRLGCIADDLAGALQGGAILRQHGIMATIVVGVPEAPPPAEGALIVALDNRRASPRQARADALAALQWLRGAGCRHFVLLCAPSFASTNDGNIGPVADALVEALDCGFALACPAAPASGHRVFQGHLFVGAALLHESGMQRDPVSPMHDANLVRVLSRQTDATVGLVPYETVAQGAAAVRRSLLALKEQGRRYGIVDAVSDADLRIVATAAVGQILITCAPALLAGIAETLPTDPQTGGGAETPPFVAGYAAVLAGSCARATLFQVGYARGQMPALELDLAATPSAGVLADHALEWARSHLGASPLLIATSATPDRIAALRSRLGQEGADTLAEQVLSLIAGGLAALGVRRLLLAGTRTGELAMARLAVRQLRVGPGIDGDVAWNYADHPAMMVAVKPGAAGGRALFSQAFDLLDGGAAPQT